MATSSNTISDTLIVGAIGIIIPLFVQNWASFLLTLCSIVWVVLKIVKEIRDWNKRKYLMGSAPSLSS